MLDGDGKNLITFYIMTMAIKKIRSPQKASKFHPFGKNWSPSNKRVYGMVIKKIGCYSTYPHCRMATKEFQLPLDTPTQLKFFSCPKGEAKVILLK
jgi:hypothetical protein